MSRTPHTRLGRSLALAAAVALLAAGAAAAAPGPAPADSGLDLQARIGTLVHSWAAWLEATLAGWHGAAIDPNGLTATTLAHGATMDPDGATTSDADTEETDPTAQPQHGAVVDPNG